jgi:hypothetical protein
MTLVWSFECPFQFAHKQFRCQASMLLSRYVTLIKKGLFNNYKQFFIQTKKRFDKGKISSERLTKKRRDFAYTTFVLLHRKHQQYSCLLLSVDCVYLEIYDVFCWTRANDKNKLKPKNFNRKTEKNLKKTPLDLNFH